jgi:hypothetical protein
VPNAPPPMSPLDPVLIAARWVCEDLLPENVPAIAVDLIEAGYEQPAVYRVAAEDRVTSRAQIERLLQEIFSAVGAAYPMPLRQARQVMSRQIAREVLAELKDPWNAALQLDRLVPHWETDDENVLAVYDIADEASWDSGYGRDQSVLESELIEVFWKLARA